MTVSLHEDETGAAKNWDVPSWRNCFEEFDSDRVREVLIFIPGISVRDAAIEHTTNLEVMDWPQGPTEIFETFHSYKSLFNLVILYHHLFSLQTLQWTTKLSDAIPCIPYDSFNIFNVDSYQVPFLNAQVLESADARDARHVPADGAHHRGGPGGFAGTGRRGEFALGAQRRHRALPRGGGAEPAPAGGLARDRDGRQGSPYRNKCFGDGSNYHKLAIS